MKITRGSIQSSRKSNANHDSDKRLNYGNERYKGYRISLDTKNGGYIVYDANGEIEDSGFKSMKSAKNFVDSLSVASSTDTMKRSSAHPKHHSKIYKGYKIIVDPAGDGYNVYNKSGDLEDEGIATMREAEEFVDSLVVNSDDVTSSTDTGSRPISFQCPVCHSLAVHSTEKSIYKLADVDHDELFVCDECCSEMFARISDGGEIKFEVHTAPSDTDWSTVESASNNSRVNEREEYCPHCTNLSLVGAGDGRAVCDSCGAEYQVSYKNGKVVKSEIISASSVNHDDVSFHDLVSEIFQAVRNKVKEVMMSYEFGFHEDEVDEYSTVNQEFRDNGQFCVFEIRAEVNYDGLVEFANQIDPIIQYYDPNAYFEPVTAGITEAYLSCETLRKFDENTKITSSDVSASTDSENHEITYEQMIDDLGYFYDMYPEAIEPILTRNGATPSAVPGDSWIDGCDVPNAYAEAVEYFETHYDNDDPHSELNTGVGERLGWSNYIQASYMNEGVKTLNFNGYDVEHVDGTFYVYLEDDAESEVMYEASSTESLDNFCAGLGEAWRKQYPESVTAANYGGAYDVDPHQYFTRDDIVDFGEYVCDHLNEIFYDTFTINDVYIVDYSRLVLEVMRTSDESIFSCNVNIDMRKVRRPSDLKDKFWGTAVSELRSEIESLDQDISSCDTIEASSDDLQPEPEPDKGDEVELEAELEFDLDTLIIVDDDGNFEYEDTTCPWIASEADSNGNFYEPEYDVYITDVKSVTEVVSDMLVTMVPIEPGRYHVTGQVKLVYNISGVYEKRTYFKEHAGPGEYTDDYDREIYSDQAEVDFLMDKSYIKNFEYEPW